MRYVKELNYKEQTKSASQLPAMEVEAPPKEIADCVLVTLAAAWVVAFSAAINVAPLGPNKQRRVRPSMFKPLAP
ncbi:MULTISPECIES: hypothetical protein [Bradyrhizobium]|uniref:hypothetical protein n=1 Tax=Bradyrhizobium TaxID=374 RepID=UPI001959EF0E|nr:hypothetical protein [Bradyrhizobium canariense]MBM7485930.1 hypothetical protein [Bradyrhizobium canariense]